MNLKTKIKKILKEENNTKIIKTIQDGIDRFGVSSAIKIFGYDTFIDFLDEIQISPEHKSDYIKEVIKEIGGFGLSEINHEPIMYAKDEYEYKEINYLGTNGVTVDVYGGENYDSHEGEFRVSYFNLKDEILDKIFHIAFSIDYHNDLL